MGSQTVEDAALSEDSDKGGRWSILRFGWGLGDQLLSSVTNFVLLAMVAREVGPEDFGAFSLAYATFTLSLGAVRALAGEPLVVRYSSVSRPQWLDGVSLASGAAFMAGVAVGLGCLGASVFVGGSLRTVLAIIGVAIPLLLVQDTWRFAFFARGRGAAALLNDLTWAAATLATFFLLVTLHRSTVGSLTLLWAMSGWLACLVGLLQLRILPSSPARSLRWLRHQRDLTLRFLAEFAVTTGTQNTAIFGVGSVSGLAQLGRLRAGQVAFGPVNILFGGAGLVTVPEGVRVLKDSPRRLVQVNRWISIGLAIGALAWGAALLVVPRSLGSVLLGVNWDSARTLAIPLSVGAAAAGLAYGAMAGLRSLAAAKRSLRTRWVDAVAIVILVLVGSALAGAVGAAWGFAAAGCLRIPHAWWQFSRALSEYEAGSAVEASQTAPLTSGAQSDSEPDQTP